MLLAKRLFREADHVVANILSLAPHNVLARMFRMIIYTNLALRQSALADAEQIFARAASEGEFIIRFCTEESELWGTLGLVYYVRALSYLNLLRTRGQTDTDSLSKHDVFSCLEQAERYFLNGISASFQGQEPRALFLLATTRCLRELLLHDDDLFDAQKMPELLDRGNVFRKVALSFFVMLGWIDEPASTGINTETMPDVAAANMQKLMRFILPQVKKHQYVALSKQYIPNIKYTYCCLFWDLLPALTVGLCQQILTWLEEAKNDMAFLLDNNLSVDVIAPHFPYEPQAFVACLDATIARIRSLIPDHEWQKPPDALLDDATMQAIAPVKLMLLNLAYREVNTDFH